MMIPKTSLLIPILLLFSVSACERDKNPPPPPANDTSRSHAETQQKEVEDLGDFLSKKPNSGAALPPGHPPIGGPSEQSGSTLPPGHPPMGQPAETDLALRFDAPEEWTEQQVRRPFRKAQYLIPKSSGDAEDGQLIVYYFGKGEGGTVALNLQRWKGMFTTADGEPVDDRACRTEVFEANGLKVTTLDVAGHYADAMRSPDLAAPSDDVFRMLAAVVETPEGPWFFKAVGPASTVGQHRDAYMRMLKTVQY